MFHVKRNQFEGPARTLKWFSLYSAASMYFLNKAEGRKEWSYSSLLNTTSRKTQSSRMSEILAESTLEPTLLKQSAFLANF